jgi:uncharacterized protein (TIGR02466 family)
MFDILKKSHNNKFWEFISKKILRIKINNFLIPNIFVDNLKNIDLDIKELYSYAKKNKKTKWMNKNDSYQSNHDLQKNKKFLDVKNQIENYLNKKIKGRFIDKNSRGRFLIKNMWFVIMKKNHSMHQHFHPKSTLSGVMYLEIGKLNSGKLNILIPKYNKKKYEHQKLWDFQNVKTKMTDLRINNKISFIKKKNYTFHPKTNDIIIFNSFFYHNVGHYSDKQDRVSLAWDAVYTV